MGNNWSAKDIPSQKGKIVIVTGANSGLGFETTKELALKGAHVILACRNKEKAEKAMKLIQKESSKTKLSLEFLQIDLMDLKSIKQFSDNFKKKYNKLDILINNAGIMWCPFGKTKDGFEKQFGTNHLGHFALTSHLNSILMKTPKSRVVNVSSLGHRPANLKDGFMLNEKNYSRYSAYYISKLANLMFTYELNKRYKNIKNCSTISVASHPGGSNTNLFQNMKDTWFSYLIFPFMFIGQDQNTGSLPTLRAATDLKVKGSDFYGPKGWFEMSGYPVLVDSNKLSKNQKEWKNLWDLSEKLTKIKFDFTIKTDKDIDNKEKEEKNKKEEEEDEDEDEDEN